MAKFINSPTSSVHYCNCKSHYCLLKYKNITINGKTNAAPIIILRLFLLIGGRNSFINPENITLGQLRAVI